LDTTATGLGNLLLCLVQRPGQIAKLRVLASLPLTLMPA
jgi:cytochrome P450